MNYLITGGTGFIGSHLIEQLNNYENSIIIFSRNKTANIPSNCKLINDLKELSKDTKIDVVINLAGSKIDRRWSKIVKYDLINSRTTVTRALVSLLNSLVHKPMIVISASAIGYYGVQGDIQLDEYSIPIANTFAHKICSIWENEILEVKDLNIRLCIIRLGIVLGNDGGMIKKILLPFKLGLGGKLGSGQQIVSWIHIEDLISGIKHLINNSLSVGIYNFTTPFATTNYKLVKIMGNLLKRPTIFTIPRPFIELVFGEMGRELLLASQNIAPTRLIAEHFNFRFPTLGIALDDIFK